MPAVSKSARLLASLTRPLPSIRHRAVLSATTASRSSSSATASAEQVKQAEASYKLVDRAADFAAKQARRPDFDHAGTPIEVTKQPSPDWQYGDGALGYDPSWTHRQVDPYAADRPMIHNYKLLVSGIAPRPVGFISTVSADGRTKNLAPFSYFQVVDHDPPTFVVGFSSRPGRAKDTFRNLQDTGECVINTVSENMMEAVNATALDPPHGVSEWAISGLHEAPAATVRPSRVHESVFSVEGKVVDAKELGHGKPGMSAAGVVLIQATRFWVREDATNDEASHIELDKLRPVAQLGGMSYGRITSTFELPRKRWADEKANSPLLSSLESDKPDA
ncbi:FMN-binding split barrel [Cordyceps militaris]|uniref:FMN-binding split barrel n=1 Tax=Cordyceps militaris TaxID=73501 RepID=A0A2H4S7G5_CORMI|nr:FMN-binding split barrel [Cordyceps militaris]